MSAIRYRHESALHYVLRTSAEFISRVLVGAGIVVALGALLGASLFGNPS